jgi:hypothetical protein
MLALPAFHYFHGTFQSPRPSVPGSTEPTVLATSTMSPRAVTVGRDRHGLDDLTVAAHGQHLRVVVCRRDDLVLDREVSGMNMSADRANVRA